MSKINLSRLAQKGRQKSSKTFTSNKYEKFSFEVSDTNLKD